MQQLSFRLRKNNSCVPKTSVLTFVSVNGNLITAAEAAAILNVSDRRIRQLAAAGLLKNNGMFGGVWQIDRAAAIKMRDAKAKSNGKRK